MGFFVVFFLYFWLVIDPRLIDHSIGVITYYHPFSFHTGWPFFWEHVLRPGGLADYATRLVSQFFAVGWVGALIATGAVWLAAYITDELTRRAGWPCRSKLRYVPATIVLVMYSGYQQPLAAVLSLLVGLGGYVSFVRWIPTSSRKRLPLLLIGSLMLYLSAGAGSLIFPVMVAVDELLLGGRKLLAAVAVAWASVMPGMIAALTGLDLVAAYCEFVVLGAGIEPETRPLVLALYSFFPVAFAGTVLWKTISARFGAAAPGCGATTCRRTALLARLCARPLISPLATVAFFSAVGTSAYASLDTFTRTVLETDYYAEREQWSDVLRCASRMPQGVYNVRWHRNITLALYHLRRLGDELFRYPQKPGVGLFFTPEEHRDVGTFLQDSRLFLELGYVNDAERCAYEALAISGDQPAVLKHLALINIVRGRAETARIFLHDLEKHLLHGRAARNLIHRLDADVRLAGDSRVSRIRENMAENDRVSVVTTVEAFFTELLQKNPHNRLAFELLMAHYLLNGRPDQVAANLRRLPDFSYPGVPRHFQEAWLVATAGLRVSPPQAGLQLDPAVRQRADDFQRIAASSSGAEDLIRAARQAGLEDSYFLYLASGVSGH